jgi:dihydroorotase
MTRALWFLAAVSLWAQQPFDLVINNGHVLDPASNLDAVRHIGIRGGKIAEISQIPLTARRVIDAGGLMVAPGFIDLHSHGQTPEAYRFKARDGVTTALEMEVGVNPVAAWYRERQGKSLINYGATSGDIPARIAVMHDSGTLLPRDKATTRAATAEELRQVMDRLSKGLDDGALGIGMGIAYLPFESRAEVFEIFQLAAKRRVPIYVHLRNSGPVEPGVLDSLQEVLADAAASGASLHVVHITSTGLRQTPLCLAMIDGAHARGLDVTTEAYPYTAGMTDLASTIFSEGWQQRQGGIGFGDLQWALTGERLTAESFARYRKQGGMVAIHSIPEEIVTVAMGHANVMIASDGLINEGKGHPRAAGTYARVLGKYVREQHTLPLMEAVRKMTILPAQRLGLGNKGKIAIGADADITVFDAGKVIDKATFDKPAQYSEGIPYVLVNGTVVVDRGELVANASPGKAVRR